MGKEWKDEVAIDNQKQHKEYAGYRSGWDKDASKFDDFRYATQYSPGETKQLLAYNQAPLAISVTTAICDTAEALMVANKPVIKTAPIINPFDDEKTNTSKKVAQIYDYLIQKSWYDSLGGLQHDRVIRDYTNVGHGLYYIVPKNIFGEFTVDIKHLSWRYFYPDPQSKDPFYTDSEAQIIAMDVSKSTAYKYVKQFESDLTMKAFEENYIKNIKTSRLETITSKYSPNGMKLAGIPFIQKYSIEEQKVYIVIPNKADINYNSMESGYKTYTELSPELKSMAAKGRIKIHEETNLYLTENTSIGGLGFKMVYPIKDYPIVPLVYDHRDNPYPLGRVWYLYPLQRALNKFMMIAILNGSLMNSTRIMAEENSIVNMDEWKMNASQPGAILQYKRPVPGISNTPIIIEAKPLGEAWLAMPRYLTYIMEFISGIFGSMMGDSTNVPNVFSTVASLQSAAGQKIRRRQAQADAALSKVGNVVAQYYREYAPINGYSTSINENGEMQPTQVYNKVKVNEKDKTKVEIDPMTDLSYGFKEIRFTTGGSSGYEAANEAALLTQLSTQLKVPEILPLILKRLNISDVDKVMENINTVSKQSTTIEQMDGVIKDLEGRIKVLSNQITQKSFELSKSQFDSSFTKMLSRIEKELRDKGIDVNQMMNESQTQGM